MNATLRERLIRAEQQFLLAVVSNDEESLKAFSQKWSQLANDIENAKAAGRLDGNTALLVSKVSGAIENIPVCMLKRGVISQETLICLIDNLIQDLPSSDLIRDIPSSDSSVASLHPQAIAP